MSKIYIVQYCCYDCECEWSENIMAFADKTEAKSYVSELEKNSKKAQERLYNFRKESEKLLKPFRTLFQKKEATEMDIKRYRQTYTERVALEQKLMSDMTEEYGYFNKNSNDEYSFQIDELTLH